MRELLDERQAEPLLGAIREPITEVPCREFLQHHLGAPYRQLIALHRNARVEGRA